MRARVGKQAANPWLVLAVLCLGFFMILLDATIVNIAIPSIIDALHAPLDHLLWVLNAYVLVYAVLLITAGRLGDIVGQRTMFAAGLTVFILASAVCGFAHTTEQLIGARCVQGVGGAMLTPQSLAILTNIFPSHRRGAAFGVWGAVAGVASIAGPTLGGLIVTSVGWRWIFYVNLPIGIVALVATFLFVPDLRVGQRQRLDVVGVALASASLLAIVFALDEGQRYHWGAVAYGVTIQEILLAGLALMACFLVWENRRDQPLVPLSLFKDRNYTLLIWVGAAMSIGMFGLFFPLTIYLQSVLGMTALTAGLTVAPLSVVSIFVAPLSGRLADRIGGKYILMSGLLLFSISIALIGIVASASSTWLTFLPLLLVGGLGLGCVFAPLSTEAMRGVDPRMAGSAAGVLNTARQLGSVLGNAIVGAVLQSRLAVTLPAEAARASSILPLPDRDFLVSAFASASNGAVEIGRGPSSPLPLPAGMPPLTESLPRLAHDIFAAGFIDAMRPTLIVPVVALVLAVFACLAVDASRRSEHPQQEWQPERVGRHEPAGVA